MLHDLDGLIPTEALESSQDEDMGVDSPLDSFRDL